MANMTHCRFQNTLEDLQDCFQAVEDGLRDQTNEENALSQNEMRAARKLFQLMRDFTESFDEDSLLSLEEVLEKQEEE